MPEWRNLPRRQVGGRRASVYVVYILRNKTKGFQYVGMTNNLARRLAEHNAGYSYTTKKYTPFEVVYTEEYPDRLSTRHREKYLKSGSGREYIQSLQLK